MVFKIRIKLAKVEKENERQNLSRIGEVGME